MEEFQEYFELFRKEKLIDFVFRNENRKLFRNDDNIPKQPVLLRIWRCYSLLILNLHKIITVGKIPGI
jgi:hypothetical protein